MARYTGSVCRICRRENLKLYLKGDRCYSDKCAFDRRGYPPGEHGQRRGRKISDYGIQLREKQKVKRMYGLSENSSEFFSPARNDRKVSPVSIFLLHLSAGWITLFTGWVLPIHALRVDTLCDIIILS